MAFILGIDGGGTKTEGVLMNSDGRVLAESRGSGSAIVGKPHPEALEVLCNLKTRLCEEAGVKSGAITQTGVGLNGIDFEHEIPMQREALAAALKIPAEKLLVVNDGIASLWGATSAERAVILQHGTGFTSAYRDGYGQEKLFDHLGICSCFDLRYEALTLLSRMIAGVCEKTGFYAALLDHFGTTPERFPEENWLKTLPREKFLYFPGLLYELWEQGDAAVACLMDRAIADYALMLTAMADRVGGDQVTAILGGGVVQVAPPAFWVRMEAAVEQCAEHIIFKKPMFSPARGAALMAAHRIGLDVKGLYGTRTGQKTYSKAPCKPEPILQTGE